jgi:hypothetical protein
MREAATIASIVRNDFCYRHWRVEDLAQREPSRTSTSSQKWSVTRALSVGFDTVCITVIMISVVRSVAKRFAVVNSRLQFVLVDSGNGERRQERIT